MLLIGWIKARWLETHGLLARVAEKMWGRSTGAAVASGELVLVRWHFELPKEVNMLCYDRPLPVPLMLLDESKP